MNAILILLLAVTGTLAATEYYELQMVQVVIRHGARTPYSILPGGDNITWDCQLNPISTIDFNTESVDYVHGRLYRQQYIAGREALAGNCSEGQLTSTGAKMQIDLGKYYRDWLVYNTSFLSSDYDSNQVYIRSADIPRCIESAQSLLLGLFPPESHGEKVELIDINTIEQAMDNLQPAPCSRLEQICTQAETTSAWQQELSQFQSESEYLQGLWDVTAANLPAWPGIYDVLESRATNGYGLPEGISAELAAQVLNVSTWQLGYLYGYPGVAQLVIGTFVTDLLTAIDNFINGSESYIFYLYSGHDTTLASLLAGFEVFPSEWPAYASHLEIKLYTDPTGDYYVGWSYNGEDLALPGCDGLCTIDQFQQLAAKLALTGGAFSTACDPISTEPAGCNPGDYYCMYLC